MSSQTEKTKSLDQVAELMKRDWNERAGENAKWFINTAAADQTESEFDASGLREMQVLVLPELSLLTDGRDPRSLKLLEIGCGIGRMTKHFAALFGEVYSTDVSGEMIRQARERLRDYPHVHFYETSGVDFAALPDDSFDAVFSAYVFQHVPSKEVIVSNIRDAWRVTKPGGILKLHTNGVESVGYDAMQKDTWAGTTFSETEIRQLARQLGAQLISIYGAGTGYCWTTLRKRNPASSSGPSGNRECRIRFFARADHPATRTVPSGGNEAWLSLVVTGLDRESVDANALCVEIGARSVLPRYTGRVRPHFEEEVRGQDLADALYVEAGVPEGTAAGFVRVRIRLETGEHSDEVDVPMEDPKPPAPMIFTVRNLHDFGTDLHARGAKSRMRISVVGLDATANCENVQVRIGEQTLKPDFVGFVTEVADYQVDVQLPAEIAAGETMMSLIFNDTASASVPLEIK